MNRAVGDERTRLSSRAAVASVTLALTLLLAKGWAACASLWSAMLGSLAECFIEMLSSLFSIYGIAAMPADHDHRFGHGKAEALVALAQVVLIAVSAIGIGWRAVDRFIRGGETAQMELGIDISLLAMAATGLLLWYQRRIIARTGSVAIRTDNVHYQSDLLLNSAVILALLLDQQFALRGADAIFGMGIAAWLLFGAYRASREAIHQLMDREWPEEQRNEFLAATRDYPELAGLHDLRTRTSGTHHFVQFHVWVPGDWTVREAHDRMDRVEEALQERFPGTEILIHLDPEGHTDRETMLPSDITESAT